jgi:hypothetical protein
VATRTPRDSNNFTPIFGLNVFPFQEQDKVAVGDCCYTASVFGSKLRVGEAHEQADTLIMTKESKHILNKKKELFIESDICKSVPFCLALALGSLRVNGPLLTLLPVIHLLD